MEQDYLRVTEIFHSIQGESTWAGLPCTFVRLTGCPLRCVWCDTEYSFHGGDKLTLDEILGRVRGLGGSGESGNGPKEGDAAGAGLVEITGGEPLIHPNTFTLTQLLLDEGFTVLVETSGAVDVSPLDVRAHKIMDLKCPGSGETDKNLWSNLDHLTKRDEIKFVLKDEADFEWACEVIRDRGLHERISEGTLKALLFSPVWGDLEWRDLAEWTLATGLPIRVQLQLHKLFWDPDAR
jgi:7-carboxy-7-deazaguanine synthase